MFAAASDTPATIVGMQRQEFYAAGIEGALYVWVLGGRPLPLGSFAGYLSGVAEGSVSPRLRLLLARAIGSMEYKDLERVGLEVVVDALGSFELGLDDMLSAGRWPLLLKSLIRSKPGLERLPLRYWYLLEELIMEDSDAQPRTRLSYSDMRTMKLLEQSQEWEKLEAWLRVLWISRVEGGGIHMVEDIKRATLSLFQHRPSTIPEFACLAIPNRILSTCLLDFHGSELQEICDQAT